MQVKAKEKNKDFAHEPNPCVSVFKNGEGPSKEQFTKAWIDMINRVEKSKL